jgi:hypothetical protein
MAEYRINRGQEFVIDGYTPDHPFDALIVGYYKDSELYYVGKVRNGFVPKVRREVLRSLRAWRLTPALSPIFPRRSGPCGR